MKYLIKGDSDCPLMEVSLAQGESITLKSGSMVYMKDVELTGNLNSKEKGFGGLLSAIGRSIVSGESMFITTATGLSAESIVGIAPPIPGKIHRLSVSEYQQYCLNTGSFVCCDQSVSYELRSQSLGKALFGGTGGFFVMETVGSGDIFVSSYGDIMELEINDENPLVIDNEHVVAWDSSLEYKIEIASGTLGIMSGEGLVNRFSGNGKILIQSRNIHALADALRPYLPTANTPSKN